MNLTPYDGDFDALEQPPSPTTPVLKRFTGDFTPLATPTAEAGPGFTGALVRGFKRALPETKSLLAGAGAAVAGAVGADGLRDAALDSYREIQREQVEPLANQSSFLGSVRGEDSIAEWAGDTIGNFGGQALQSAVAAGAGALVGSSVPGAGTAAGAVGGLLARGAVKKGIEGQVAKMVAAQAGRGAVEAGAEQAARQVLLRRLGGGAAAATALNIGQETGIGYTGRAEDAAAEGEGLTPEDAARAIAAGVPAGLIDTAAEALAAGRVLKGASAAPGVLRRVATGAAKGAAVEGATEAAQAVLERVGADRELATEEAGVDYIENAAAGALGGGVMGGGSGLRRHRPGSLSDAADALPGAPRDPPPSEPGLTPDGFRAGVAAAHQTAAEAPPAQTDLPLLQRPPVGSLSDAAAVLPMRTETGHPIPQEPASAIDDPVARAGFEEAAPPDMDPATGEVPAPRRPIETVETPSVEAIKALLNAQFDQGRVIDPGLLSKSLGISKRRADELVREVRIERKKTALGEATDDRAGRGADNAAAAAPLAAVGDVDAGSAGATAVQDGMQPADAGQAETEAAVPVDAPVAAAPAAEGPAATDDAVEREYDESPELLDDDITPPSGGVFTHERAAELAAKRQGGGAKAIEVDGGFVVRMPRAVPVETKTPSGESKAAPAETAAAKAETIPARSETPAGVEALKRLESDGSYAAQITDPDVREFVLRSTRAAAEEKESDPADWTPEQRAAYDRGDTRRFSELRGYAPAEIENFERFVQLANVLDERYGSDFAAGLDHSAATVLEAADAQQLYVQLGNQRYPVADLADASRKFEQFRDTTDAGSRELPDVQIVNGAGGAVGRISYNGRVWAPGPRKAGEKPLYDNQVAPIAAAPAKKAAKKSTPAAGPAAPAKESKRAEQVPEQAPAEAAAAPRPDEEGQAGLLSPEPAKIETPAAAGVSASKDAHAGAVNAAKAQVERRLAQMKGDAFRKATKDILQVFGETSKGSRAKDVPALLATLDRSPLVAVRALKLELAPSVLAALEAADKATAVAPEPAQDDGAKAAERERLDAQFADFQARRDRLKPNVETLSLPWPAKNRDRALASIDVAQDTDGQWYAAPNYQTNVSGTSRNVASFDGHPTREDALRSALDELERALPPPEGSAAASEEGQRAEKPHLVRIRDWIAQQRAAMESGPIEVATAEAPATHVDPGAAPEAATPSVIAEAIATSAKKTPLNPAQAAKHLLAQIDDALKTAPTKGEAMERAGVILYKHFHDSPPRMKLASDKSKDEVGTKAFEQIEARSIAAAKAMGQIVFDVPGDGKFTVLNTRENLQAFREKVAASPGFKPVPKKRAANAPLPGAAASTVVRDFMVDDQQTQVAKLANVDAYLEQAGKPLRFGVGRDNEHLPYALAEATAIDGLPVFVGMYLGGGKNHLKWEVVEPRTGMTIGAGGSGKDAALTAAKARVKMAGGGAVLAAQADKSVAANKIPDEAARRTAFDAQVARETQLDALAAKVSPAPIKRAAAQAATSPTNDLPQPTEAQKEAGNYAKGHVIINGLDVSIENPAGSRRRPEWPPLAHHYGYIKRTEGADGEHVDVFLSEDAGNADLPVFVVDQFKKDGGFDEHKVMLGFADEDAARAGYAANYTKGWKVGPIARFTLPEFKSWLRQGDTLAPAAATAAAREEAALAQPPNPGTLDGQLDLLKRLGEGTATLAEYRAGFKALQENRDAIKAELGKLTKEKLVRLSGFGARLSDPKDRLVRSAYSDLTTDYNLTGTLSYVMGSDFDKVLQAKVDQATDETLRAHAEKHKAARQANAERIEQVKAGLENPTTIEDFTRVARAHPQGEAGLTPEQRATFDRLRADARAEERDRAAERNAVVRQVDVPTDMTIVETKHTQKGHDLFVIQLGERVEREVYDRLNGAAKRLGGHYSSYRGNGAVPGFTFTTRDAAEQFLAVRDGNVSTADAQAARAAVKDAGRAETLATKAETLREKAEAKLNADRKDNTRRRAAMAASAEANARAELAMADTMASLGKAIEEGRAKLLRFVRHRTQVELLERTAQYARDERMRALKIDWEKVKDTPPAAEHIVDVALPAFRLPREDMVRIIAALRPLRGAKQFSADLEKLVDYGEEYGAAVQANPHKFVLMKSLADGSKPDLAFFSKKKDAEAAIASTQSRAQKQGLVAPSHVVVKLPRAGKTSDTSRDWAVAMSPEAAIARNLWRPDYDKKVAISPDAAQKMVDLLGRNADNRVLPWWIPEYLDRRAAFAKLGITTNFELREALREYLALRGKPPAVDKVKELERALQGKNVGVDFFPTPPALVERLVNEADIRPGMRVLEPSAGKGDIATALRDAAGDVDVTTVELSSELRDILEAKGFEPVGQDFLKFSPEERFDRIVMNPPFGTDNGAAHVRHAHTLLKPGGRLVAIIGAGSRGRAEFDAWLEKAGGYREPLPEGAFLSSFRPTGVRTELVVVEAGGAFSRPDGGPSTGMSIGEVNTAIAPLLAAWAGPRVHVVATAEFLPPEAKQDPGYRTVEGFYAADGRDLYLVAGNLRSADRARRVLAHELVGHASVEAIVGPQEWPRIVADVQRLRSRRDQVAAPIRKALDAVERRYAGADPDTFARETLAVMAEQGVSTSVLDRVLAAVRRFLRTLGFAPNAFSQAELRTLLGDAFRYAERGEQATFLGAPAPAGAFSKGLRSAFSDAALFAKSVGDYLARKLPGSDTIRVTEGTPDVLFQLGARDLPITIERSKIDDLLKMHPEVTPNLLKQLVRQIHEPVAVFESRTEPGALVVVTALEGEGMPLVAAIHLNRRDSRAVVNRVASVYGRANAERAFQQWADAGALRYVDTTKAPTYLTTRGLRLPKVGPDSAGAPGAEAPGRKVLTEADVVKPFSSGDGRYSAPAKPFYSALAEAVTRATGAPKKGDAAAWKGWLDGAQRRGEFKQEERDWIGLDAWLDDAGTVSREQLSEFVRANEVQVTETVLGGKDAPNMDLPEGWMVEGPVDDDGEFDPNGEFAVLDEAGEVRGSGPTQADAIRDAQDDDVRSDLVAAGAPKFGQYQLPGGENYRELLLTLPERTAGPAFDPDKVKIVRNRMSTTQGGVKVLYDGEELMSLDDSGYVQTNYRRHTDEALMDSARHAFEQGIRRPDGQVVRPSMRNRDNFRSSHFDQPNVLAHVRFNERTDADGKRVLFIEEIQSDWHQQGRRQGYAGKEPQRFKLIDADGVMQRGNLDRAEADALAEQHDFRVEPDTGRSEMRGVPDAPFKTTWPLLALKRMVRYAAENGFERIAWTTGEQQAQRYDLSKHVREVYAERYDTGRYLLTVTGNHGNTIFDSGGEPMSAEKIESYVGKELAEKIVKDLDEPRASKTYSGLDLKVGGEGMRGFYDKILPAEVNKWAKRFGAKVGQATINTQGKGLDTLHEYAGPPLTLPEVEAIAASANSIVDMQLRETIKLMRRGVTFHQAATQSDLSIAAAAALGGEMRPRADVPATVHALDIPQALRESALEGLPLFARPDHGDLTRAFAALAKLDRVFQYPTSDKDTLAGVLADTLPTMKVREAGAAKARFEPSGKIMPATRTVVQMGDDPGQVAVVWEEQGAAGRLFVNAASLESGKSQGSALYLALFNYAKNAGKVFVADPSGLSDAALLRRTELMAAAAVKFGGTSFMEPGPRQLNPDRAWATPVVWDREDPTANTESLLRSAYNNARTFAPEIADATLDLDRGELLLAGGKPATREELERIAARARAAFAGRPRVDDDAGAAAFGRATIARGLFAAAVLRGAGEGRSELVDRLEGQRAGTSAPAGLKRALYSRPDAVVDEIEAVMAASHDGSLLERTKAWIKDATPVKIKDALRSTWLGALTTRHLTELGGDYFGEIKFYSEYLQRQGADRNAMQAEAEGIAESARKWVGKHHPEAKRLFKLMHDATIDGVDPAGDYKPLQFRYGGAVVDATRANVKEALKALREQMRGRSGDSKVNMLAEAKMIGNLPKREKVRKAAYPSLVQRWNELSPEAKAIYVQFRDLYEKRSSEMEDALVARIQDADVPEKHKRKIVDMIRHQFESARLQGVYFPLQRFGKFFVAAEKDGEPTFLMFESLNTLERAVKGLRDRGFTIKAQGLKSEFKAAQAPSGTFVASVINALGKAGVSDKTQDEVYQLYLQALPELSMRKHSIHRQAVAGFDPDAVRAFAWNMHHGAHQLARLRYGHKLQAVLDLITKHQDQKRTEPDADTRKIAAGDAVVAELARRHDWIQNPQDSNATNIASSFGFIYYLGLTPAAALVNLTQTAIVSYPYLASRFGAGKAMNALLKAGAAAGKTIGHMQRTLTDPEELAAHQALQVSGALDKTQAHNLAGIGESGVQGYNPAWAKAMEIIGWGFHKTEVINREATGMAAFRLARAEGIAFDEAVKIASDAINDTHYDYTNANRARFMQSGTAKVLLMFRQYSLNTTWHLGRMVWQATKNADPAVRKLARRNLAGVMGMAALFAGTLGLPLVSVTFGVLNAIAASFGDDDEPWDAETEFRNFLADMFGPDLARVLATGAVNELTGADLHSRVSMSQLWFRDSDRELDGRGAYYNLLEQAAGPLGGVLKNALVGKQQMDEGQVWRGVETVLPKALKDSMKGMRYTTQGVNNLRGDALVKDVSLWQAMLQLNGFTPAEVAEQYDANAAIKGYEKSILDRRSRLMNAYALAYRLRDGEGVRAVVAKIRRFNTAHPELPITAATIRRSLQARARYSARAEGGIILNPKLEAEAREEGRFAD